jgi:hypothetical protein
VPPEEQFRLVRVRGQLVRVRAGASQEEMDAALAEREARAAATAAVAAGLPSSFEHGDPRPLLLVDVDGVVCPYADELVDPAASGLEKARVGYSEVWLSRDIAGHLQALGELFQIVWCTAWEVHAAEYLGPFLGLPALPVIHFDEPIMEECHWNWPAIDAFVEDRSFAWIDDEIGRDDLARARARAIPTLLVSVEGTHGLDDIHVEQLERFAESLRAPPDSLA